MYFVKVVELANSIVVSSRYAKQEVITIACQHSEQVNSLDYTQITILLRQWAITTQWAITITSPTLLAHEVYSKLLSRTVRAQGYFNSSIMSQC